jgi:cyclopropane fatty-acyl-phospholipid synthase-like methyltransferase
MIRQVESDLDRELEYHEKLYSGFAQRHFAKPAVRAMRQHLVERMVRVTGIGKQSRVLSVGCGIADTELLLAPHVREVVGIDLSPTAIEQAKSDAARAGVSNFRAACGPLEDALASGETDQFDAVIAIFFLHHLSEAALAAFPSRIRALLRPGGTFYALDPSRYRLTGFIGEMLFPKLMARYQSPGERQLSPRETAALFESSGFNARHGYYDFVSTPLAGLFPAWSAGYRTARIMDELLIRTPGLRRVSSNFEVIAKSGA